MSKMMENHPKFLGAILGFSAATLLFSTPLLVSLFKGSKKNRKRTYKVLGFEMGGTSCKVSLGEKTVDEEGKVLSVNVLTKFTVSNFENNLEKKPEEIIDALVACVINAYYEEVGIAHFGPLALDHSKPNYGSVTTTPKLGWVDFHSLEYFKQRLPLRTRKVSIETDVNAAALAEFLLGGHKVRESLAYITVGTGVGVGLVIDGKPVHGLIHPEGGHSTIRPHEYDKDFKGTCPRHGKFCVEGVISNISIAERRGLKDREDLHTLDDNDVIWEVVGFYLGQLCANIVLTCSPEVIILGGGVMKRKTLKGYLSHPKLENPELFIKVSAIEDVGLKGAMVL